jgi:hypothetical protein
MKHDEKSSDHAANPFAITLRKLRDEALGDGDDLNIIRATVTGASGLNPGSFITLQADSKTVQFTATSDNNAVDQTNVLGFIEAGFSDTEAETIHITASMTGAADAHATFVFNDVPVQYAISPIRPIHDGVAAATDEVFDQAEVEVTRNGVGAAGVTVRFLLAGPASVSFLDHIDGNPQICDVVTAGEQGVATAKFVDSDPAGNTCFIGVRLIDHPEVLPPQPREFHFIPKADTHDYHFTVTNPTGPAAADNVATTQLMATVTDGVKPLRGVPVRFQFRQANGATFLDGGIDTGDSLITGTDGTVSAYVRCPNPTTVIAYVTARIDGQLTPPDGGNPNIVLRFYEDKVSFPSAPLNNGAAADGHSLIEATAKVLRNTSGFFENAPVGTPVLFAMNSPMAHFAGGTQNPEFTNEFGEASIYVYDTNPAGESVTLTASLPNYLPAVPATQLLTFQTTAHNYSLTLSNPSGNVPADGTSYNLVTATFRDGAKPVAHAIVQFSLDQNNDATFEDGGKNTNWRFSTDAQGEVTVKVRDPVPQSVLVYATGAGPEGAVPASPIALTFNPLAVKYTLTFPDAPTGDNITPADGTSQIEAIVLVTRDGRPAPAGVRVGFTLSSPSARFASDTAPPIATDAGGRARVRVYDSNTLGETVVLEASLVDVTEAPHATQSMTFVNGEYTISFPNPADNNGNAFADGVDRIGATARVLRNGQPTKDVKVSFNLPPAQGAVFTSDGTVSANGTTLDDGTAAVQVRDARMDESGESVQLTASLTDHPYARAAYQVLTFKDAKVVSLLTDEGNHAPADGVTPNRVKFTLSKGATPWAGQNAVIILPVSSGAHFVPTAGDPSGKQYKATTNSQGEIVATFVDTVVERLLVTSNAGLGAPATPLAFDFSNLAHSYTLNLSNPGGDAPADGTTPCLVEAALWDHAVPTKGVTIRFSVEASANATFENGTRTIDAVTDDVGRARARLTSRQIAAVTVSAAALPPEGGTPYQAAPITVNFVDPVTVALSLRIDPNNGPDDGVTPNVAIAELTLQGHILLGGHPVRFSLPSNSAAVFINGTEGPKRTTVSTDPFTGIASAPFISRATESSVVTARSDTYGHAQTAGYNFIPDVPDYSFTLRRTVDNAAADGYALNEATVTWLNHGLPMQEDTTVIFQLPADRMAVFWGNEDNPYHGSRTMWRGLDANGQAIVHFRDTHVSGEKVDLTALTGFVGLAPRTEQFTFVRGAQSYYRLVVEKVDDNASADGVEVNTVRVRLEGGPVDNPELFEVPILLRLLGNNSATFLNGENEVTVDSSLFLNHYAVEHFIDKSTVDQPVTLEASVPDSYDVTPVTRDFTFRGTIQPSLLLGLRLDPSSEQAADGSPLYAVVILLKNGVPSRGSVTLTLPDSSNAQFVENATHNGKQTIVFTEDGSGQAKVAFNDYVPESGQVNAYVTTHPATSAKPVTFNFVQPVVYRLNLVDKVDRSPADGRSANRATYRLEYGSVTAPSFVSNVAMTCEIRPGSAMFTNGVVDANGKRTQITSDPATGLMEVTFTDRVVEGVGLWASVPPQYSWHPQATTFSFSQPAPTADYSLILEPTDGYDNGAPVEVKAYLKKGFDPLGQTVVYLTLPENKSARFADGSTRWSQPTDANGFASTLVHSRAIETVEVTGMAYPDGIELHAKPVTIDFRKAPEALYLSPLFIPNAVLGTADGWMSLLAETYVRHRGDDSAAAGVRVKFELPAGAAAYFNDFNPQPGGFAVTDAQGLAKVYFSSHTAESGIITARVPDFPQTTPVSGPYNFDAPRFKVELVISPNGALALGEAPASANHTNMAQAVLRVGNIGIGPVWPGSVTFVLPPNSQAYFTGTNATDGGKRITISAPTGVTPSVPFVDPVAEAGYMYAFKTDDSGWRSSNVPFYFAKGNSRPVLSLEINPNGSVVTADPYNPAVDVARARLTKDGVGLQGDVTFKIGISQVAYFVDGVIGGRRTMSTVRTDSQGYATSRLVSNIAESGELDAVYEGTSPVVNAAPATYVFHDRGYRVELYLDPSLQNQLGKIIGTATVYLDNVPTKDVSLDFRLSGVASYLIGPDGKPTNVVQLVTNAKGTAAVTIGCADMPLAVTYEVGTLTASKTNQPSVYATGIYSFNKNIV